MPEALDLRSAFEAAEHAAAAGDYTAAERLLSDAASQQEVSLGPLHPDLANTLNNLAVVYETIDKPGDAERCYRRAYAIAIAALEPDHPFVATSEKNLRDFCDARGKPFERPVPPPAVAPTPAPLEIQTPELPRERPATNASRVRAAGVLSVVAIVALIALRMWFGANGSVEPAQETATPQAEPIAVAPKASSVTERPVAVAENRRVAPPVSVPPTVVEANLCSGLSLRERRCDPVTRPVDSGQLFFYTRVKAPASTTVEHRWYHGDRLHRRVELRVQTNLHSGYRTYSRTAVSGGDWRVEVRTRDGAVLHEERFAVR